MVWKSTIPDWLGCCANLFLLNALLNEISFCSVTKLCISRPYVNLIHSSTKLSVCASAPLLTWQMNAVKMSPRIVLRLCNFGSWIGRAVCRRLFDSTGISSRRLGKTLSTWWLLPHLRLWRLSLLCRRALHFPMRCRTDDRAISKLYRSRGDLQYPQS